MAPKVETGGFCVSSSARTERRYDVEVFVESLDGDCQWTFGRPVSGEIKMLVDESHLD